MSERKDPHRARPRAIHSSRPMPRANLGSRPRPRPRPRANLRPESYYTKKIAAREKAVDAELLTIVNEGKYSDRQLEDHEIESRQQTMRNIIKKRTKDKETDKRDAQKRLARRIKAHDKTVKNINLHRKVNTMIHRTNIDEANKDFDARVAQIEQERRAELRRLSDQYGEIDYRQYERVEVLIEEKKTW